MFIGHYGVSFAAARRDPSIPLWVLFLAVQWLDVIWAPLVLLGVEKYRVVPGITASNPLDLYYMPYTHSLVAAIGWSAAGYAAARWLGGPRRSAVAWVIAAAIFSHWVLDLIVHRPDLPLYDNHAKVGLGLWNRPLLAFALEALLLFGGMILWFRTEPQRRMAVAVFGCAMLAVQAYVFFGPPPASTAAGAVTALAAYGLFATIIALLDRRPRSA